jgi:hypothetical protein
LEEYSKKVEGILAEKSKEVYSGAEWLLIPSTLKSGKFLSYHSLLENWKEIDRFLTRESKLYCFIQGSKSALVERSFKFWVFFKPGHAATYFKGQLDRPKEFGGDSIITLPHIRLQEPFMDKVAKIVSAHQQKRIIDTVKKIFAVIDYCERFLQRDEKSNLEAYIKSSISEIISMEIDQLLKDIHATTPSSTLIQKRLKSVLRVGWRYFRTKNELETEYYKKLLSDTPDEQEKGLKLAKKKIIDFRSL